MSPTNAKKSWQEHFKEIKTELDEGRTKFQKATSLYFDDALDENSFISEVENLGKKLDTLEKMGDDPRVEFHLRAEIKYYLDSQKESKSREDGTRIIKSIEKEIEPYKAKLDKLALFFADEKISEESYLASVKTIENGMQNLNLKKNNIQKLVILFENGKLSASPYHRAVKIVDSGMKKVSKLKINPNAYLSSDEPTTYKRLQRSPYSESKTYRKPITTQYEYCSDFWYLLPIVFGLLGGIIGYVGVKDRDPDMARNILLIGFVLTLIGFVVLAAYWSWWMSIIFG